MKSFIMRAHREKAQSVPHHINKVKNKLYEKVKIYEHENNVWIEIF